ncbi:hypothetical protein DDW10_04090 [Sulfolobales archaeon SCGC AB-777_J03]|nr:hypothetical protein DDW10_04090 [Sulfolobales archaeon SCGC AB-777_J03]
MDPVIKKERDRIAVHGVYPPAVSHMADMWENEPYNGRVINNLLGGNVIDNPDPEDPEPTIHYPVVYFDDMLKDLEIGKRAMDMAREMGYDTMEIGTIHIGKRHGLGTDIYFY